MRVRSKLLLALGLLLSVVLLDSVFSLGRAKDLLAAHERVRHSHAQLEAALEVTRALAECSAFAGLSHERAVVACAGAERRAADLVRVTDAERAFVESRGESVDEDEEVDTRALFVAVRETSGRLARVVARGDAGGMEAARAIVRSEAYSDIGDGLERAVAREKGEVRRVEAQAVARAGDVSRLAWLCLVAAVVAATAAALWTLPRFLRSLEELLTATRRVALGDLGHRAVVPGNDELAELGAAFNGMLTELEQARARKAEVEAIARQSSRRAGRAEVAAAVLHDVGNALNSVVVSSSLLAESFEQSRLGRFPETVEMLRLRDAELGAALANDAKGRALLAYLDKLAEHWQKETRSYRSTLSQARAGIDHVARVVGKQQEYATGGFTEPSTLESIVDDALLLTRHAFDEGGVALEVTHAEPELTLLVDRHVVIEILVNLLNNARDALKGRADGPKLVRVSSVVVNGEVRIAVHDNGPGVAPEHRARLFEHGFTTKPDGHGFGLYSSAALAVELGGRLTHESEVEGAEFLLAVPLEQRYSRTAVPRLSLSRALRPEL